MYDFTPKGVCPSAIEFDIVDGKMRDVRFAGGCNGNLKAVGILIEGMDARECASKMKGIHCGFRPTSCGDQLAAAIEEALKKQSA